MAAAILFSVQGVTGALWANQEILTSPPPRDAHAHHAPRASLDEILSVIHAHAPRAKLDRIMFPDQPGRALVARVIEPEDGVQILLIDPMSARIFSSGPIWAYPGQWAEQVHGSLLLGPTGHWVLFGEGLCLMLMAATGLAVWWPGLRRLRSALTLHLKAPPRRLVREAHLVPGALAAGLLLISGFTGSLMAVEPLTAAMVARFAPIGSDIDITLPVAPSRAPPVAAQAALVRLQQAFPAGRLFKVRTMGSGDRMILGIFADGRARNPKAYDMASYDRATGVLTIYADAMADAPGDAAIAWLAPVHAGEIYGPFRALIATASGLTLVLMALTGLSNWVLGIRSRKRRPKS